MTQEELDDVLRQAEQGCWSHVELLDRLLGERAQRKRQRTVEGWIREARFVMGKPRKATTGIQRTGHRPRAEDSSAGPGTPGRL